MRFFYLRLFFHGHFWPRAFLRFIQLLFQRKKLRIGHVALDRAFYFERGTVVLDWEIENAWLIRVGHPGGYYRGSDHTWMTAQLGMAPIELTAYGWHGRQRFRLPVRVKAYQPAPARQRLAQAQPRFGRIHAGPAVTQKGQLITRRTLRFRHLLPPSFSAKTATLSDHESAE